MNVSIPVEEGDDETVLLRVPKTVLPGVQPGQHVLGTPAPAPGTGKWQLTLTPGPQIAPGPDSAAATA